MSWTPIAWAAGLLLLIFAAWRLSRSRKPSRASYIRKDFLLSTEERQFFQSLWQAVGEDYVIFGRIRIIDIIAPRSTAAIDSAWDALEALGEEHFPFVLCRQADLSIACAIQLIQHKWPNRKTRDLAEHPLKTICVAAGLPLLRLETAPFYDRNDIREAIAEAVRKEPLFISETDGRKEPTIVELEKLEL